MKVAVWDTYVTRKDKNIMHFDIIVPADLKDENIIHSFGKEYLKTKNQEEQTLSASECRFCHMESARPQWESAIQKNGYYIYEMENCNDFGRSKQDQFPPIT